MLNLEHKNLYLLGYGKTPAYAEIQMHNVMGKRRSHMTFTVSYTKGSYYHASIKKYVMIATTTNRHLHRFAID
jgi:hypothetical protein